MRRTTELLAKKEGNKKEGNNKRVKGDSRNLLAMLPAAFAVLSTSLCMRTPPPSAATAPLLDALAPLGYAGFDASAKQRREVESLLKDLIALNPNPQPAVGASLDGDWELIYSDAPDITGLANSGPLLALRRVGQQIDADAGTIQNVIEYGPRSWLPGLDLANAREDVLQQRVLLSYSVAEDGRRCRLQISGLQLGARQLLGTNLRSTPPLTLKGFVEAPFGDFTCLYNDGDVRVVRTLQGYYGVNRRCPKGRGWDA